MKKLNIMTSCDNNLALYIMPQLASIHVNMPEYDVHFYLFHYRISSEKVNFLANYAKTLGNITFHEVRMENEAEFEKLAKHGGHGGSYPPEAYVYLNCHNQLPQDIDRILYIDAGDVIFHGDISGYYFDDFEGKSFIATHVCISVLDDEGLPRLLSKEDFNNPARLDIIRGAMANGGCVMVNLEKFRTSGENFFSRYTHIIENTPPMQWKNCEDAIYTSDEGLMTLAFFGDIKFFGYESLIKNIEHTFSTWKNERGLLNAYAPYNFFNTNYRDYWYIPVILHYAAGTPKPWKHRYAPECNPNPDDMTRENMRMHDIYWEYAALTPLYETVPNVSGLNPAERDKNIAEINPSLYMAGYYLLRKNYDKASEYLEKGLAAATVGTDSFRMLCRLKARLKLKDTPNIISKQLKNGQTMFGYKGEFIMNVLERTSDFFELHHLEGWYKPYKYRTVFDIGANIGNHTVYFATHSPDAEIFAFEPMSINYLLLEANIEANGFSRERVHLINKALGSEKGFANMQVKQGHEGNNGAAAITDSETGDIEKVEVLVLDELNLPAPDFVKIDVEGYEVYVLRGMIKTLEKSNALVWIEVIPETMSEIAKLMDTLDFEVVDFGYGTYPHIDFLFCKKGKHTLLEYKLIPRIFELNQNFCSACEQLMKAL